jgi:pyruvate-ferredoxin/flavodoxin oxidoreductase
MHFFDGFRTSHEVNKIEQMSEDDMRAMINEEAIAAHRARALSPDHPVLRGTAQNPDVFFQGRETINPYYTRCPEIVQATMDKFATITGRTYHLFDYAGAPDAERVLVAMGSGAETAEETAKYLSAQGEKVGVVTVHLYRPFSVKHFMKALPATTKVLVMLDRTKEPGALGEPLYQDVVTAVSEALAQGIAPFKSAPRMYGGRYGLSSKEFTPAMVKGVFDEMAKSEPKNHFTIGITDDVSFTSLEYDPDFEILDASTVQCVFYGLGSDGTVGANKNSIKIIGEETDNFAQGYYVYDSKKSGTVTISHLRFGPKPIHAAYVINKAQFIACHHFSFLDTL